VDEKLPERLRKKVRRRKKKRSEKDAGLFFAVGTFGIVGWSVSIPTLAFLALGLWLDQEFPSDVSWTVAMLLAGITLGSFNAWYWVSEHARRVAVREEEDEPDMD